MNSRRARRWRKFFGRDLRGHDFNETQRIVEAASGAYALARLAKRYYGGGRTMLTDTLKQTFDQLMTPAKDLPPIQEKARSVNMGDVMAMIQR